MSHLGPGLCHYVTTHHAALRGEDQVYLVEPFRAIPCTLVTQKAQICLDTFGALCMIGQPGNLNLKGYNFERKPFIRVISGQGYIIGEGLYTA